MDQEIKCWLIQPAKLFGFEPTETSLEAFMNTVAPIVERLKADSSKISYSNGIIVRAERPIEVDVEDFDAPYKKGIVTSGAFWRNCETGVCLSLAFPWDALPHRVVRKMLFRDEYLESIEETRKRVYAIRESLPRIHDSLGDVLYGPETVASYLAWRNAK